MKKGILLLLTAAVTAVVSFLSARCLYADAGRRSEGPIALQEEAVTVSEEHLNVPGVCQYPELPTGCESAAAAAVLQYWGEDIEAEEFAGDWLSCSEDFYWENGTLYGPDPRETFAGDPFSQNAYGCFASPIARAVNENSENCEAMEIKGGSLGELCEAYIRQGKPLLIWGTSDMEPSHEGDSWLLPDGTEFIWPSGEHCLVFTGYSETCYFFMDPQTGETVSFSKRTAEERYRELGKQAVYIYRTGA